MRDGHVRGMLGRGDDAQRESMHVLVFVLAIHRVEHLVLVPIRV
jgi:hypothetical protein